MDSVQDPDAHECRLRYPRGQVAPRRARPTTCLANPSSSPSREKNRHRGAGRKSEPPILEGPENGTVRLALDPARWRPQKHRGLFKRTPRARTPVRELAGPTPTLVSALSRGSERRLSFRSSRVQFRNKLVGRQPICLALSVAVANGRGGTPVGGYELFKCWLHIVKQRFLAPSGDFYEIVVRAPDECGDKFD